MVLPTRFEPYQKGDKVWLEGRNLNTTHPSSKLAPRRYGPFPITRVVSCTSYQLKLPPQWKLHDVFHATLLTPYKETALNGQSYQEPAPDLINGQPEWEVGLLLRVRVSPTAEEVPLVPVNTRPPSRAYTEPSEVEVDIGMIGRDLAIPSGFSMFDRTILNHHNYGQKIKMPDATFRWPHYIQFIVDTTTHNHYVYATRDDLQRVKYGWVLEAAPFTGCTLPGVDETDLQILLGSEDQHLGIDIALNTINDKGVTADTDRLRELAMEDIVLTRREQELADERTSWRVRNAETRA